MGLTRTSRDVDMLCCVKIVFEHWNIHTWVYLFHIIRIEILLYIDVVAEPADVSRGPAYSMGVNEYLSINNVLILYFSKKSISEYQNIRICY